MQEVEGGRAGNTKYKARKYKIQKEEIHKIQREEVQNTKGEIENTKNIRDIGENTRGENTTD